jgi:Acetyltransferase (GNAT) domain
MRVTLEPFDLIRDSDQFLGWLAQPHVAKWWGDADRAIQHARECVPESHALIVAEGTPVGYLGWQQPPKEELEAANLTDLPRLQRKLAGSAIRASLFSCIRGC